MRFIPAMVYYASREQDTAEIPFDTHAETSEWTRHLRGLRHCRVFTMLDIGVRRPLRGMMTGYAESEHQIP